MENEENKNQDAPRRGRPPKDAKEDVKTVDNAILTQLLDKMNRMEDELASVKEKNKRLETIAGKSALADYDAENADNTQKLAHFKVYDGQVIVGWRNTKNEVKKINGTYVEDIRLEAEFIDGSKKELDYTDFIRCHTVIKARIVTIDHKAGLAVIDFPEAGEKTIPIKFLNA